MKVPEKIVYVLRMLCGAGVIVFVLMDVMGMWEGAVQIYGPLLGMVILLQAVQYWKKDKFLAISSLCVAIMVFAVVFLMLA